MQKASFRSTVLLGAVCCGLLGGCASVPDTSPIASLLKSGDQGWAKFDDYERGKHYLAAGDYGLAVSAFTLALQADRNSVSALNGLAIAYSRIGRDDVSENLFRQALQLDQHSALTLNNVSTFYLSKGDTAMARVYAAQASAAVASAQDAPQVLVAAIAANTQLSAPPPAAPEQPVVVASSGPLKRVSTGVWQLHVDAPKAMPVKAAKVSAAVPVQRHEEPMRAGMAVRLTNASGHPDYAGSARAWLGSRQVKVSHVGTAQGPASSISTIFYSQGKKADADRLAAALPRPVHTIGLTNNLGAVELVLGADLKLDKLPS